MKYFDTFTGYGGFTLGIQRAYGNMDNRRDTSPPELEERRDKSEPNLSDGNGWRANPTCIGYSEVNKYAIQVYEKHFPYEQCTVCKEKKERAGKEASQGLRSGENKTDNERNEGLGISTAESQQRIINGSNRQLDCECKHKPYGDITQINPAELPDFDLLTGGFPCQAFSIAGKRQGFNDTRGTLFFDIARILKEKRPRNFILENVKGLLSHDNGRTFKTIITTLTELGYCVEWQVLNAKNHGVPQNRERVFIVGHFGGIPERKVFPLGEDGEVSTERQRQISPTITSRYHKQGQSDPYVVTGGERRIEQLNQPKHSNDRIYGDDGLSPALNTMQGGNRQPKLAIPVLTPDRPVKRQNGRRFKENGEPSFTLTGQDNHGISDGIRIRRLTPKECERLMSLPDKWTAEGTEGKMSDTQRYKLCGNGVVVNVVEAIVRKLYGI